MAGTSEKHEASQKSFDWDRATKLSLLEHLALPEPPIGIISSRQSMTHALKAIDSLSRASEGFTARVETIANRMGASRKTAQRALLALEKVGVLIIVRNRARTGQRANTYRICWSNLKDFDSRDGTQPAGWDTVTQPLGHGDPASLSSNRLASSLLAQNSSSSGTHETTDEDGAVRTAGTKDEAVQIAERIAQVVPVRFDDANRSLVTKVGWLCASGQIDRSAVENVIEAVRANRPVNRGAYFHACLNRALDGGLNKLMGSLRV